MISVDSLRLTSMIGLRLVGIERYLLQKWQNVQADCISRYSRNPHHLSKAAKEDRKHLMTSLITRFSSNLS